MSASRRAEYSCCFLFWSGDVNPRDAARRNLVVVLWQNLDLKQSKALFELSNDKTVSNAQNVPFWSEIQMVAFHREYDNVHAAVLIEVANPVAAGMDCSLTSGIVG